MAFAAAGSAAVLATVTAWVTIQREPWSFGLDLTAYTEGAKRLLATGSPYSAAIHLGPIEHTMTNVPEAYLYPPLLAQLFVPFTPVPHALLAIGWALAQGIALAWIMIVLTRRSFPGQGHRITVVVLLATAAFFPTQIAIYGGNISAWIAVLAGFTLLEQRRISGTAAVLSSFLKASPAAIGVGALLDRRSRRPALYSAVTVAVVSIALSPFAWLDWLQVLPSLAAMGAGEFRFNLAPANVMMHAGFGAWVAMSLAVPALFMGLTAWNALRGRTLQWVTAATGVYLTATATSWLQYFVVLAPIAVVAWPGATVRLRGAMILTWLWYGPMWHLAAADWHMFAGLVLWLTVIVWITALPALGSVQRGRTEYTLIPDAPTAG